MIVRTGMNVKYTHDEEALTAELLSWREFRGVGAAELETWMKPLRPWAYWKEFWYDPQYDEVLRPTTEWIYCTAEIRAVLTKVRLWKVQDTARELITENGFCCPACGSRTRVEEIPSIGWGDLAEVVRGRQSLDFRPLICQGCAYDLNDLMNVRVRPSRYKVVANNLIDRVTKAART